MSNWNETPPGTFSSAEIVECLKACIKYQGLERTFNDFQSMERLLSRMPVWAEVRLAAESLFAEERQRQVELELAHARAAAPNIYQVLPSAMTGVATDGGQVGQLFMDNHGNVKQDN